MVNAFLHELVKYKCKQKLTLITKIQINEKNALDQHCDEWFICDCVIPKSSVIQTIHCNVGLKCFFQFYQNVCLLSSLCMYISLIFYKVV